jgi:peroxiredoxin
MLMLVIYGIVRSDASTSSPGLTDPNAFNPAPALLSAGQTAPDFTLQDANGKTYHLAAQRAHPVLLEFFAVWCPVCQAEAPTLARITSTYTSRGVRVWSILASPYGKNYDLSGRSDLRLADTSDLTWFARTFNVQHPQLIDPSFAVVNQYGIHAYPGLYVINGKGVITQATSGRESYAKLSRALDQALKASRG